jgi:hypothetical protein
VLSEKKCGKCDDLAKFSFMHKLKASFVNAQLICSLKRHQRVKMARREKPLSEKNSTQLLRKFQLKARLNANWIAGELMKSNVAYRGSIRIKMDAKSKNSSFYSLTRPRECFKN